MSKHESAPLSPLSRRQFLYRSALAAGAAAIGAPAIAAARGLSGQKLNIGVVGVTGKGAGDLHCCSGENIIALCDVDEKAAAGARDKYPKATFYKDFRKMLEREKSLDAVIVATPDHLHATIAATAIRLGKHVYCQKPLTQTVYEARLLRHLAKQYNVATQMGNQGSAEDGLRRAVEVVQAGFIGPVREVHVWSNRPVWPQGMDRPAGSDPVPAHFDWDLWLGPAPWRPFKAEWPAGQSPASDRANKRSRKGVYHPFVWRGWQDFGTGALGDMACHTANMPFRALKLGYPTEVQAQCSGINRESYPSSSKIRFQFPAREDLPELSFWWYDGGQKPDPQLTGSVREMLDEVPGSGCLLIGDKGQLFSPDDYGAHFFVKRNDEKEFLDGRAHDGVRAIPERIARNAFQGANDQRHHSEWIAACKGGKPGYSDFDIAAYLTEIILLGCVALRVGRTLEWDGPNMTARNATAAAQFVRREPRRGWEV